MTDWQQALLLRVRCELEELVTKREGMIARNHYCRSIGQSPQFVQHDFDELSRSIAAIAPDPHQFS